jgi:alkaline phosphatase
VCDRAVSFTGRFPMFVLVSLLLFSIFPLSMVLPDAAAAQGTVKNVILMIVDGCSSEQYTLLRWVKGGPLSFDKIYAGAVKTYIADSVIADSAPAASAYATGRRTSDKHISVGPAPQTLRTVPAPPPDMRDRPLATLLEGAKLSGMAVGIVCTSRVSHATPAAFYAHVPDRDLEDDIMEQAVYQNLDLLFGGGKRYLLPKSGGGKRVDGEDLMAVLKQKGYRVIETRAELLSLASGRVFGMFSQSHMEADMDRATFAPEEPSLEEMTRKAIELLSRSRGGFFLMVEASQVDWACHANDPAHLISDLSMYDKAVKAALEFAEKDGTTLLVAVSDHNTGGMSIGNNATSERYSQMKLGALDEPVATDTLLGPLGRMTLTAYGIWRKMGKDISPSKLKEVVRAYWGMEITDEEANQIFTVGKQYPNVAHWGLGEILSAKHTSIGWTTHGHTGGDVPLFAYGPGHPVGLVDAPELGRQMAEAMGLDLGQLTERLFVEAGAAFPEGKVTIEKDGENLVARITLPDKTADLPINKDILMTAGRSVELEGVVVYAPNTGKVYVPSQAVERLEGAKEQRPSDSP